MLDDLIAKRRKIGVVGLGYVGILLAATLAKKYAVIGYDINEKKVQGYCNGIDPTGECRPGDLCQPGLELTARPQKLAEASFYIVAVPTPVDKAHQPRLEALVAATRTVGAVLAAGDYVVYESTVYPGFTENVCIGVLEEASGLKCGRDFKVGYSPERINPGDKVHRLDNIVKVVSGIDEESLDVIARLYESIIDAGVFRAANLKTAEAVKLMENTQRDVNIAFMNEIAIFFHGIGVDTKDVVEGMNTKWNSLEYVPGLVGGHCIGVDPYYFIYEAEATGSSCKIATEARRLNNKMGAYVGHAVIKGLVKMELPVKAARVYILGAAFKENCRDLRNSQVKKLVRTLADYDINPILHDCWVEPEEQQKTIGCPMVALDEIHDADCLVITVGHREYAAMTEAQLVQKLRPGGVVIDVKRIFDKAKLEQMGFYYWGL